MYEFGVFSSLYWSNVEFYVELKSTCYFTWFYILIFPKLPSIGCLTVPCETSPLFLNTVHSVLRVRITFY